MQNVLITGASGGLGASVTRAFLDNGARVTGVARSITAAEFNHASFVALAANIATAADARKVVDQAGDVDVLVHLVGAFAGGMTVDATDDATFEKMLDINLRAAFHLIGAVIPGMRARKSGSILAIGSRSAAQPVAGLGAYSASKAALVSLVQTVALENKDHGITASIVLPGTMDTPANRAAMPGADTSKWVQPSDVASLLVHLAGNRSLTGAVIPLYGGDM